MLGYILFIALLNLGLGFALAAYWGRTRRSPALEDPEPAFQSSAEDTAAARASLQARLASRKKPVDSEPESVPPDADGAVAETAVAAADAEG